MVASHIVVLDQDTEIIILLVVDIDEIVTIIPIVVIPKNKIPTWDFILTFLHRYAKICVVII